MAYIKKEPIIEFITKGLNNPDKAKAFGHDAIEILTEIEYAPTADVVPKSEVERLQHILDSYALQYGTVMDKHLVIEKARAELAREIFEEIESISEDFPLYGNVYTVIINERDLAVIKKKYTEGGE